MARNVDDIIDTLSPAQRKRVEARALELSAEELTLQELRRARKLTQTRMAKSLHVAQKQISEIEKRTDMHISTLRRQIEAMGGSLALVATFPDRRPVVLAGISDLDSPTPRARKQRVHA
ncbi:MAG: XRE family transcriptional regulator [Bryobacteraceae bacterium]